MVQQVPQELDQVRAKALGPHLPSFGRSGIHWRNLVSFIKTSFVVSVNSILRGFLLGPSFANVPVSGIPTLEKPAPNQGFP